MRGFSNRAFAQPNTSERAERLLEALQKKHLSDAAIARRFAPERPYSVVVSNPAPAPRASVDELAMLLNLAGKSFAQGFRCLWGIKRVITTRAKLRVKIAYHRVVQNRFMPWALAGGGWGMSMGLALMVVVR